MDKKEFRQAWMKKKKELKTKGGMDSLYEKCQKQEMNNTQGTGSEKLTRDKLCAAQEQPIRTNYGDHFVECMTRK